MATRKTLRIGQSNFGHLVENNHYLVDKTLLIKEFLENPYHIILITRPRRFGKTMNLSMIEHFFDHNKKDSESIFDGFQIASEKEICQQNQNQYPVINLTLKSIKATNWEECFGHIKKVISDLYKIHKYLLDYDELYEFEKEAVKHIILQKADTITYQYSLKGLAEYLYRCFNKQVVILIDEYDTPIINGYKEGYYNEIISFMKIFLGQTFKDNDYLFKGLITGIMRVAKESIFSEMNNPGIFTVSSYYFSDKFGFTENETKHILQYFSLEEKFENIKHWYNGYKFGNISCIYNPYSIVSYIAKHEEGFKTHWVNTGSDPLIRERVKEGDIDRTYNTLQDLISGKAVEKSIDENFVFTDFDTKKELLWTLLTYSGYLTQVKETKKDNYLLKIPNLEVKTVFEKIVLDWLSMDMKISEDLLKRTTRNLINNNLKEFENGFRRIMGDTISYFDAKGEPENIYQAYTLGLLAIIGDEYFIKSNRESEEGRYDILLLPHNTSQNGVVIEIKSIERIENEPDDKKNKRIDRAIEKALNQIEDRKYYQELISNQIPEEKILKVPIIFVGKETFVCKTGHD
jgi:hypothetical protein